MTRGACLRGEKKKSHLRPSIERRCGKRHFRDSPTTHAGCKCLMSVMCVLYDAHKMHAFFQGREYSIWATKR
jgi:hypothetical protein